MKNNKFVNNSFSLFGFLLAYFYFIQTTRRRRRKPKQLKYNHVYLSDNGQSFCYLFLDVRNLNISKCAVRSFNNIKRKTNT